MAKKKKAPAVKIAAPQLMNLLLTRHHEDLCVPECKTGPSWQGKVLRMDLWTMKRSWSNPRITGYEVKVARSDFLRDEKWRGYLPYCNVFYFVAPPKIIAPEELPEGVGLIVSSVNATRLYTKKKALFRAVQIPEEILIYILMSRTKIKSGWADHAEDGSQRAYWQRWLQQKAEDRELGYNVSKTLAKTVADKVDAAQAENERVQHNIQAMQETREELEAAGLWPISKYAARSRIRELIVQAETGLPKGFENTLDDVIRMTTRLKKLIVDKEEEST